MSPPNEGRQSPPPEQQTGAQQQDAPSNAKGVNDNTDNKETSKSQLENLESNPKHVLDEHVEKKFSKTS